jgi:hypothetical protein
MKVFPKINMQSCVRGQSVVLNFTDIFRVPWGGFQRRIGHP